MAAMLRVPRSRGAFSGVLLVLLGAWGVLIPLIGPSFDYSFTPDTSWHYTEGRLLLEFLPGAGAFLGGLIVLMSANRAVASFGGWLAAASGAWFVVGRTLLAPWTSYTGGRPTGGTTRQAFEEIGFYSGLGVVIVLLAGLALGRFAVVGVREIRQAEREAAAEQQADRAESYSGLREQPTQATPAAAPHFEPAATAAPPVGEERLLGSHTETLPTADRRPGE